MRYIDDDEAPDALAAVDSVLKALGRNQGKPSETLRGVQANTILGALLLAKREIEELSSENIRQEFEISALQAEVECLLEPAPGKGGKHGAQ